MSWIRHPITWATAGWLASMAMLGVAMAVLLGVPDKWDRAIAIKVCGSLPVVQRTDGSIWLRHRWRAYRVKDDDPSKLC